MEKHFIIQDVVFLFVHVDGKKNIFKESVVMLFCSRMLRPLSLTKEKSSSTLIASSIL